MYKVTIIKKQKKLADSFFSRIDAVDVLSDNERQLLINFEQMDTRLKSEGKIISREYLYSDDGYTKTSITIYIDEQAYLDRQNSIEMKELNNALHVHDTNHQMTYEIIKEQI